MVKVMDWSREADEILGFWGSGVLGFWGSGVLGCGIALECVCQFG